MSYDSSKAEFFPSSTSTGFVANQKRRRSSKQGCNQKPSFATVCAKTSASITGSRALALIALSMVCSDALVATTLPKVAFRTGGEVSPNNENAPSYPSVLEQYESSVFLNDEEEEEEEYLLDDEEFKLLKAMDSMREIQNANGADVLSAEEQELLDDSSSSPERFLRNFGGDDSGGMEHVAIASIPQQLPQAPLEAFLEQRQRGGDMQYATDRVSFEQELQLGRLIQAGTKLFRVKDELTQSLDREPTKQEWANAANLESTKTLRRTISAYRTAKHKLVTANMGLVHSVAKQNKRKGISMEELVQEGSLGLLRAAELYDPTKGLRFSTYAVVWIKGMLSNSHVLELVRVPARERTKWNKIQQAVATLKDMDEGAPSPEAISALTDIPIHQVIDVQQRMLQSQYMVSLDAPTAVQTRSGSETTQVDPQASIKDDDDVTEIAQMQADIIAALTSNLTPREARLMRLRYGLSDGQSRTLHQCADAMGLSYSRVYQLSKECLSKLRKAADAQALEEYLLTIA